jgi:ankyrin repeat protein
VLINMVRQLLKKKNVEDEKLLLSNLSILFKHNIDINLTDSDGRDAITYAIMNNSVETIRYLIKNGKKINF